MYDTGSPVSIISIELYDKLGSNKPKLVNADSGVVGANGSKFEILGKEEFKLETPVKTYIWPFIVANLEGQSSLLGQDFIVSQGRTLNCKTLVWNTKAGIMYTLI